MPTTKTYPPELKQLIERAMSGDSTVIPALAKAFDDYPELIAAFGDLAAHAEQALLTLAAGPNLVAREAITRQLAGLRSRLTQATTTELEKLLVDRVALSWLAVSHADIDHTEQLAQSGTSAGAQAAGKRLDAAHRRFLAAARTLATVEKLLRRAPSPIEMLRAVPEVATPRRRAGTRSRTPMDGDPVLN